MNLLENNRVNNNNINDAVFITQKGDKTMEKSIQFGIKHY